MEVQYYSTVILWVKACKNNIIELEDDEEEEELEEIEERNYVGNIFDEYDEVEKDYEKIDENTYIINGSVSIYDLRKILDIDIPEGDYDTLSGYLIEKMGRLPEEDEHPVIEDLPTPKKSIKQIEKEHMRRLKEKSRKNILELDE